MPRLAILSPSRGLLSGPRCEALLNELKGVDFKMFSTNDRPIPESFNEIAASALEYPWEYAWFVEEDVVVPRGTLKGLLDLDADISAVDYMLKVDNPILSHREINGKIAWVALGCTLVKRRVFHVVTRPWFRTDKMLEGFLNGSQWELRLTERVGSTTDYGNQDVYFCTKAIEAGCKVGIVPQMLAEHVNVGMA